MEAQHQEQVDRLLREANVFRMRRQFEQAEERCRAALAVAPADSGVMEMLGDLLREQDQPEKAAEQYRQALEQDPKRTVLEKKYAELVLALSERQRQRDLAQLALSDPSAFHTPRRKKNAVIAAVLSLMLPGLGQLYVAESLTTKCLILAVSALLLMVGMMQISGVMGWGVFGLLLSVLQLYAARDAVVEAGKTSTSTTDRLGF